MCVYVCLYVYNSLRHITFISLKNLWSIVKYRNTFFGKFKLNKIIQNIIYKLNNHIIYFLLILTNNIIINIK